MRTVTIEKDGTNYTVNPNATSGGEETYPPMASSQTEKMKYLNTVTITFPPTNIEDVSVMFYYNTGTEDERIDDKTAICFKCTPDKYAGFDFEPYGSSFDKVELTLGDKVYEVTSSTLNEIVDDLGSYVILPEKQ